jgi:signal transduction histidine kinase
VVSGWRRCVGILHSLSVPALRDSQLFSGLLAAELRALEQTSLLRRFPAGEPIFTEGDPGHALYVINRGRVEISALVADGERKILAHVTDGDFFGEMAVLDDQPRSASAVAEVESEIWEVSRDELLRVLERSPQVAVSLLRAFSQRLREFDRQYVAELLNAERLSLVGRFTRSILHDIKGPLSVIAMASELATLTNATDQNRKTAAERIRKQVDRISNMINELIEFTRGSRSTTIMASLDYPAYVAQLIEEIRPELALRRVEISGVDLPSGLRVRFDPRRIAHVFMNLIHNACDAMTQGGKITIRIHVEGNEVFTEIRDTGPGIPPEIADRLFEPFVTFGKTRGTGLGLSISKRVVQDHRGRISVVSEPGKGAAFTFVLPLG